MEIGELKQTIKRLIGDDGKPVIVWSAMWPFMKALDMPMKEITPAVLDVLMDVVGPDRSLLMPSYGPGYKNGTCNLDEAPGKGGMLAELFRRNPQTRRTLSAFFSFNILGPQTPEVVLLQPQYAYGEGSLYEWMEKTNAHFLMLGTHPVTSCYPHRIEWLLREKISYRYNKTFTGTLVREGKQVPIQEILYVRSLDPEVINDFTVLYDDLKRGGMTVVMLDGVHISHIRAMTMKEVYLPLLQKDPLLTVQNRGQFER